MDNSEGYFILYRKIFSDPLWLNGTPAQKLLMVLCIGKANHEDRQWQWLGEKFEVKRGQFVTSIERLKMGLGKHITIQNVRSALNNLEKYHFLTMLSTKAGRLITVLNYDKYQIVSNKDTNIDLTKNQQRTNKELTTNNNNNKDKKEIYIINNKSKDIVINNVKSKISPPKETIKKSNDELCKSVKIMFNELCPSFPEAAVITKKRRIAIINIFKSFKNEISVFEELFSKAEKSDFLSGRNGRWTSCSFDWLLIQKNYIRVLEGTYDNR